jgi:hypothetical protein
MPALTAWFAEANESQEASARMARRVAPNPISLMRVSKRRGALR